MRFRPGPLAAAWLAAVGLHSYHGIAAAQPNGCTVGVSAVACPATARTIVVAQSGTANFRYIQHALDAALPGDTIAVRSGVYSEPAMMRVSGTPFAPVTLKAYPGEHPVIQPTYGGNTATVALSARWLVLDGFEVRGGRHGVVVSGSNNVVSNNYIHDNGLGCGAGELCGQGVIVSSATDVAIVNNRIERNGLAGLSPWQLHGIYLSNWTGAPVSRVSVIGNIIRQHAGAGFQAWDPTAPTVDVLIQGNTFENNTIGVILSNMKDALLKANTFIHVGGHPPTNAPRSAMVWLEFSRNVAFEANTFRYRAVSAYGVPPVPIHYWATDQSAKELRWRSNTWDAPGLGLSDAALNVALTAGLPGRPMLAAEQSAGNPVSLAWAAGAGQEASEYFVVAGSAPGASDAGVIPMSRLNTLTGAAPVGSQLFVRVMGRNAVGMTTSNEVLLRVAPPAAAPVATPVMLAPAVSGNTATFSWQASGQITGFTLVARYTAGGAVIAAIPVAGGVRSLAIAGVPSGVYVVSVVAHNGSIASAESVGVVARVNQ